MVSDVHTYPVHKMVTVRLDQEAFVLASGQEAQERSQLGLGFGVKVNFGLLEKKRSLTIPTYTVHENRKDLTDSITNVNQVDC